MTIIALVNSYLSIFLLWPWQEIVFATEIVVISAAP